MVVVHQMLSFNRRVTLIVIGGSSLNLMKPVRCYEFLEMQRHSRWWSNAGQCHGWTTKRLCCDSAFFCWLTGWQTTNVMWCDVNLLIETSRKYYCCIKKLILIIVSYHMSLIQSYHIIVYYNYKLIIYIIESEQLLSSAYVVVIATITYNNLLRLTFL